VARIIAGVAGAKWGLACPAKAAAPIKLPPLSFIWRRVMNLPRCPHLDRFAQELVEAYRRAEEHRRSGLLAGREVSEEIEAAHQAMAQHRRECPLCSKFGIGTHTWPIP
jgi:hypothetical protein